MSSDQQLTDNLQRMLSEVSLDGEGDDDIWHSNNSRVSRGGASVAVNTGSTDHFVQRVVTAIPLNPIQDYSSTSSRVTNASLERAGGRSECSTPLGPGVGEGFGGPEPPSVDSGFVVVTESDYGFAHASGASGRPGRSGSKMSSIKAKGLSFVGKVMGSRASNNTLSTESVVSGIVIEDPLLAEYKRSTEEERSNTTRFNLETVMGHVVAFATDPEGSRGLQRLITDALASMWDLFSTEQRKGRGNTKTSNTNKVPMSELAASATDKSTPHSQAENLERLRGIFKEMEPFLIDVILDGYANYVVQKFIETQASEFLLPILARCHQHVYKLSVDSFGCRVLQNLLEACAPDAEVKDMTDACDVARATVRRSCVVEQAAIGLIGELRSPDIVFSLIMDQNGNHVLQKCLMFFPQECAFVAQAVGCRFMEVAKHVYGSRVIQCIFEQLKGGIVGFEPEQASLKLMMLALENCDQLVNTQYGNFVVTHALINSPDPNVRLFSVSTFAPDPSDSSSAFRLKTDSTFLGARPSTTSFAFLPPNGIRPTMVSVLAPSLLEHSCSKFASNVAQRVFEYADTNQKQLIVRQLLAPKTRGGVPNAVTMMTDQYANYVIQSIFDAANDEQKADILAVVRPFAAQILKSHFGRHIMAKIAPDIAQPPGRQGQQGGPAPRRSGAGNGKGPNRSPDMRSATSNDSSNNYPVIPVQGASGGGFFVMRGVARPPPPPPHYSMPSQQANFPMTYQDPEYNPAMVPPHLRFGRF